MKKMFMGLIIIIVCVSIVLGISSSAWYYFAIPIGFLFGYFLQKGDLCASSAMSEAIMFRDRSKLWGFWIAIVTTMLSLSIIDYIGWISVNPKPFLWLSSIVGGLIFGVGMVFAGGCVSGVLFKSGTGNINSIMALMGVPFGVAAVELGPLNDMHLWMKSFIIKGADGESLTLYSVTGIPYMVLAILFVAGSIIYLVLRKRKLNFSMPLKHSWKPWVAGIALGILGIFAFLSSSESGRNYPLGVTHGVYQYSLLMFEKNDNIKYITSKPDKSVKIQVANEKHQNPQPPKKKVNVWLVLLVLSLIAGSWFSGALSGQSRLLPKDPQQTLIALTGGLMIGVGAAFAGGCSIGNIMSGLGMMSLGNLIFAIVVLLANWATTYFYLMGGKIGK